MLFVAFYLVPKGNWSRWCRTRENEADSARNAARGESAGANASVGDDVPDEWAGMLTRSGRLTVGRQHSGGLIDDFEDDISSDHSSEDNMDGSNQPVLLFAP